MYKFHNWRRKQFAPDAGGSAGGADAAQAAQAAAGGEAQAAQTTFTLEEVTRLIQSEGIFNLTQEVSKDILTIYKTGKRGGAWWKNCWRTGWMRCNSPT